MLKITEIEKLNPTIHSYVNLTTVFYVRELVIGNL